LITLPKPPIFSFKEILWFLDRNYDDCLFVVSPNEVRRLVRFSEKKALISVKEGNKNLRIELLAGDAFEKELRNYITKWFDLNRDLNPFYDQLNNSSLSYMTKDFYGLRMVGIPDLFEAICWCIIGQQINLNFAYKIKRRFVEAYGDKLSYEGVDFYTFPQPEQLSMVTMNDLKEMQFSRQKADYILTLAKTFIQGGIDQDSLSSRTSVERKSELLKLKGVGEWTANYVLMKTFGEMGSIPFGDIGLFKALENHQIITDRKDRKKIEQFFESFPGWGGYLTLYLWRSLANSDSSAL